ncbi:aspartic proteinase nepenthesin-1-like [Euphorbia lathyris]|uniref:aspartic proteinase nepenthesin-1-like n=1 Tax=Euphorbia lathyris TaxID=212925 RepID=UPI0033135EAB
MPQPQIFLSSIAPFLIILLSFLPFSTPKSANNGFSFQLIHTDSLHSPFYDEGLTHSQRLNRLAESSKIRANSLELDTNSNSSLDVANPQTLRFNVAQNYVCYLVSLQFGTPSIPLYLILDTGSSLVWTQCEPCTHRFRQERPIYNSTASPTFKELPCQHPFCRNNNSTFTCQNGKCVYRQTYLSGDVTEGVAASDFFRPLDNTRISLQFGCSRNSRNFTFLEHTGRGGGIMGLSLSPISILQQLGNITQHRFSYCLVPYDQLSTAVFRSLLRFGNDINTHGRTFESTPIISPPNMYAYYLDLLDISIGNNRLNFPPNTFSIKRDGSGGCIIDSGTTLTHFSQSSYPKVKTAFQNYFRSKGFTQVHMPPYDLCYINGRSMDEIPTMTFHFRGADFEVEGHYLIMPFPDHNAFCIGIQQTRSLTILGAIQQGNTRFIYDAAARQLLFSPENCMLDSMH